ncbi:MAG: hypothetical protein KTR25_11195 [Myxococcales bacterium]|nr:hypothetical protein [Myxococcales bacterium]
MDMFLDEIERLDTAGHLATAAAEKVNLLLEHMANIQTIDENHNQWDAPVEDLEHAWAKINLLVHQCDVIARKPLTNEQGLEGDVFDCGNDLLLKMPNLRCRGEDSLALFKDIDEVVIYVGPGGPIEAAAIPTVLTRQKPEDDHHPPSLDGSTFPPKKKHSEPPPMTLGTYRVEVHYSPNTGLAHVYIYTKDGNKPIQELLDLALNHSNDQSFAMFDNGLTLVLNTDALAETGDEEALSTIQFLELQHERGEFLATSDGILCAKSRPRDFESHAHFLEKAIETAQTALEDIEEFREKIDRCFEQLIEQWTPHAIDHPLVLERLAPHHRDSDFIQLGVLLAALGNEPAKTRTPEWHYLKNLHQTASPSELLSRTLERAEWDLISNNLDRFLERLDQLRRSLNYEDPHTSTSLGMLLDLVHISQAVATGNIDLSRTYISHLIDASRPNPLPANRRRASIPEERCL